METRPAAPEPRRSFSVEKWYCDVFLEDGSFLLVVAARLRLLGLDFVRLNVEWYPAEGPPVLVGVSLHEVPGDLLQAGVVRWDLPAIAGELTLQPRHEPIVLRDPLLSRGSRQLRWSMVVPDADATGWLRVGDRRVPCRGRAYRDHIVVDLLPWMMRGWILRWGRAVSAGHSRIWFQLLTRETAVQGGWQDGVARASSDPPALSDLRVLADGPIVELPIFDLGAVKHGLAALAGGPHQRRVIAATTLDGLPARAIHEEVRWR